MTIKRARERKGLTQDAVARKAAVSRGYLNRLEAGRQDPTVGTLRRIAKALGVAVTELLE